MAAVSPVLFRLCRCALVPREAGPANGPGTFPFYVMAPIRLRGRVLQPQSEMPLAHHYGDLAQRFGGRTIAALVVMILTIVLIGIVTSLSWWTFSSSSGGTSAWYLGNVCSGTSCQSYQGNPAIHDAFGLTNTLVLSSLTLSIFGLVFFILSIFWPRLGIGALITGAIGSVLLLIAPIYLYFALPGAISSSGGSIPVNSFFGSYTQTGFFGSTTYSWGGGTGWFMAFVVFASFLVSTLVAFSAARRILPLGNVRVPLPATPAAPLYTTQPPQLAVTTWAGGRGMFCPTCGSHYPAGTQFCSKDASALKEVA